MTDIITEDIEGFEQEINGLEQPSDDEPVNNLSLLISFIRKPKILNVIWTL